MIRNFKWFRKKCGGTWHYCEYEDWVNLGPGTHTSWGILEGWFKEETKRYEEKKDQGFITKIIKTEKYG